LMFNGEVIRSRDQAANRLFPRVISIPLMRVIGERSLRSW
jgi:hypothetical protein